MTKFRFDPMNDAAKIYEFALDQIRRERDALSTALGESLDEIRRIRTELNALKEARAALSEPGDEP